MYFLNTAEKFSILLSHPSIWTREWRRLHNKQLYALYSSPNIILVIKSRRLGWTGYIAWMEDRRGAYRFSVEKPEGRRPVGRLRRKWEDNIKMDFREVRWGIGWIDLAQYRERWRALVNTVMTFGFDERREISWVASSIVLPTVACERVLSRNFKH